MTDQETVRCFVYGTLRPGDYNHGRVGGTVGEARSASANGQMFHAYPGGRSYPVAKFDLQGIIQGDVVEFEPREWLSVVSMEEGAGYECWDIFVNYEDGSTEQVKAWQYRGEPRGTKILSGDWFDDDAYTEDEEE